MQHNGADLGKVEVDGSRIKIRKRKTLTDQLYGQILEQIVSGRLQEGEKLPSEHQICDAFEVSRPVVREALRRLQEDRLIESRRGVGSFVRKRPPQGLIEYTSAGSVAGLMRVTEARMTVENATARMAALRADAADLARIESSLDALERSMGQRQPSRDPDFEFHLAVAEASHNEVYVTMLCAAQETMQRAIEVAQSITRGGSQTRVDRVLREHRQVFEAILSRDAEAAGLSMSYHLLQARQRITDHARED